MPTWVRFSEGEVLAEAGIEMVNYEEADAEVDIVFEDNEEEPTPIDEGDDIFVDF